MVWDVVLASQPDVNFDPCECVVKLGIGLFEVICDLQGVTELTFTADRLALLDALKHLDLYRKTDNNRQCMLKIQITYIVVFIFI